MFYSNSFEVMVYHLGPLVGVGILNHPSSTGAMGGKDDMPPQPVEPYGARKPLGAGGHEIFNYLALDVSTATRSCMARMSCWLGSLKDRRSPSVHLSPSTHTVAGSHHQPIVELSLVLSRRAASIS